MKLFVRGGHRQRPQYIGSSYNVGSNSSVTVNAPAGSTGDILVAVVAANGVAPDFGIGGGPLGGPIFTTLATRPPKGEALTMAAYRVAARIAQAGDNQQIVMTAQGASSPLFGCVRRYRPGRALNLSSPNLGMADGTGGSAIAPGIFAPAGGGLLTAWYFASAASAFTTPPAGYLSNLILSTGGASPLSVMEAERDWPGPGSPPSATAGPDLQPSTDWGALSFLIV